MTLTVKQIAEAFSELSKGEQDECIRAIEDGTGRYSAIDIHLSTGVTTYSIRDDVRHAIADNLRWCADDAKRNGENQAAIALTLVADGMRRGRLE